MKRSNTQISTSSAKKRTTASSKFKRVKLSAPTSFPLVKSITEAKNEYALWTPAAINSGQIYYQTFGGINQGISDANRIGKAVSHKYADIYWQAATNSSTPYLAYRVIVGVVKFSYADPLLGDSNTILEGTPAAADNILRPINGLSSKYAVILHDKYYKGNTPSASNLVAGGIINEDPVSDHQRIRVRYGGTQTFATPAANTATNFYHFMMVINADGGHPLNFRYTTNNYFTDA